MSLMQDQSDRMMTRKERRQLRRQEARQRQSWQARKRGARKILLWGVAVAVLVCIGWLVWQAGKNAVPNGTGGALAFAVNDGDNVKGVADAPITLVEYGDYQCSACAQFHLIIEQLFNEADGSIRWIYRHFPLESIHPNAEMTARAVQAAGLQGMFWEMHALVYERQAEWSELSRSAARDRMLAYAAELGMDPEQLERDMDSDVVKEKVENDAEGARQSAITATPTFFVNGKQVSGYNSFAEFRDLVLRSAQEDQNMEESSSNGTVETNF